MDKTAVLASLAHFRAALSAYGIRDLRLVLFGSYARGNPHLGSDIDVVVVSPDFEEKSYWERVNLLSAAIYDVFEPIEAVALTPQEWDEKKSRIVIYASEGEVIA